MPVVYCMYCTYRTSHVRSNAVPRLDSRTAVGQCINLDTRYHSYRFIAAEGGVRPFFPLIAEVCVDVSPDVPSARLPGCNCVTMKREDTAESRLWGYRTSNLVIQYIFIMRLRPTSKRQSSFERESHRAHQGRPLHESSVCTQSGTDCDVEARWAQRLGSVSSRLECEDTSTEQVPTVDAGCHAKRGGST